MRVMMARSFRRTWLYVGREFLFSFIVSFLFFFFIFFINQILVMAEEIFAKRVPFWDVVRLIGYSLPWVVALSFPFGALVGGLMAVGRLSSDNEVLAFSSLGIPARQLLVPLLVLGLAFSAGSFIMNDYFLPLGNIRFAEIYRRILYTNPAVELEPHAIKKFENTVLVTGDVEGKRIGQLLIIDRSPEGTRRVITAGSAALSESAESRGAVSLTLNDVLSHESYPREGDRYDYTLSRSMVYTILLKNITVSFGSLGPSQQSSVDVWREIRGKQVQEAGKLREKQARLQEMRYGLASAIRFARDAVGADPSRREVEGRNLDTYYRQYSAERGRDVADKSLQVYLVEFHRKFSVPAACVVFAFFAFPVGLLARRSGRTVGFGVGLFVSILYYGLLFAGQTFGVRMSLSPAFSMWLPDAVVFLAGGAFLLLRVKG
jgi:lipopolysaccharide export system permease protein